jgi:hypothetical protein
MGVTYDSVSALQGVANIQAMVAYPINISESSSMEKMTKPKQFALMGGATGPKRFTSPGHASCHPSPHRNPHSAVFPHVTRGPITFKWKYLLVHSSMKSMLPTMYPCVHEHLSKQLTISFLGPHWLLECLATESVKRKGHWNLDVQKYRDFLSLRH